MGSLARRLVPGVAAALVFGWLGVASAQVVCEGGMPNGATEGAEECDDGNTINGDTCDNNCTTPRCGNFQVVTPETCDDGGNEERDFCPADCIIDACERTEALVQVTVSVSRPDLAAFEGFLEYPEGKVDLLGTGTAVPAEVASGPGTATFQPNDYDHAIKLVAFDLFSFGTPNVAVLRFTACTGAPVPEPQEFPCTVDTASDENLQPLPGVTCGVSIVADTTTTTTVATATTTTSTTLPCVTVSCIARAATSAPACEGITVPAIITQKLELAATLAEQAASATGGAAKKLKKKAKRALKAANKKAKKLAKGANPQLDPACSAAIQSAVSTALAALNAGQL